MCGVRWGRFWRLPVRSKALKHTLSPRIRALAVAFELSQRHWKRPLWQPTYRGLTETSAVCCQDRHCSRITEYFRLLTPHWRQENKDPTASVPRSKFCDHIGEGHGVTGTRAAAPRPRLLPQSVMYNKEREFSHAGYVALHVPVV